MTSMEMSPTVGFVPAGALIVALGVAIAAT
jgi:hypothetical protein